MTSLELESISVLWVKYTCLDSLFLGIEMDISDTPSSPLKSEQNHYAKGRKGKALLLLLGAFMHFLRLFGSSWGFLVLLVNLP